MLADLLGLSKQFEVLLIIIAGIIYVSLDSSVFFLNSNLDEVWNYDFSLNLHHQYIEIILKYLLSGVILVRAFTTHIYLAFYIVMLWPTIFEERPNLMVPWLIVGSVRSVAVNFVTLITGSYICITQKGHHPICFDFFLSQIIDHGPSLYAWLTIYSYYKTLHTDCSERERAKSVQIEIAKRRRISKCMNSPLLKLSERVDDGRNLISESMLSNLLRRLESESTPTSSRSLDSLLKLKSNKEAKDEILLSGILQDDESNISVLEKAMRLLKIENQDIIKMLSERTDVSLSVLLEEIDKELESASNSFILENEGNTKRNQDKVDRNVTGSSKPVSEEKNNSKKDEPLSENEVEISSISFDVETPKATKIQESEPVTESKECKNAEEKTKAALKKDFLEKFATVMQNDIKKMVHFGCQVSTLSRTLLDQPADEVTKRFRFSKKILFNAW